MVDTLSCYMYSTSKQAKANNIDLQYEPATEHIKHNNNNNISFICMTIINM